MHSFIIEHIKQQFQGRTHLTPIEAGALWGWAPPTSYHHVSGNTFPIKLTPVGSKQMVSIVDYVDFMLKDHPQQATQQSTRRPGRPSNKSRAEAVAKGTA